MREAGTKFNTVDEYIASFDSRTRTILEELRQTIGAAAPGAEEVISYNMPPSGRTAYWYITRHIKRTLVSTLPARV